MDLGEKAVLATRFSDVLKIELGERRLDVVEFLDLASALRIDPIKVIRQLMETDSR